MSYKLVERTFMNVVNRFTIGQHLCVSLLLRLLLIAVSEVQDHLLELKYTDIDYTIFTDGAIHVSRGESPFMRHTYRYTPLLAILMLPNVYCFPQFGKLLFSVLDVTSGALIYLIACQLVGQRRAKISASLWLYNPLPAIISTRGSAETVVTALVLLTILFVLKKQYSFAGLVYGFVIHFKLYPIIYALGFYLSLTKSSKAWKAFRPNRKKAAFFVSALFAFIIPTFWSFVAYGDKYVEESWAYHLHRKDPQHNFSPYFYIYHLTNDKRTQQLLSYSAFIPQALIVLSFAFKYCVSRKHKMQDLMFALFAQTAAFVTLNKVITSQYFLWYFCVLPLIVPYVKLSARASVNVLIIWLLSQAQWLIPAYLYEFQNWNCLLWVWIASCVFVFINLALLIFITNRYKADDKKQK